MRIVFMGTPEIAVFSLDKICKSKHQVVAVVTAPDRPAGRGLKLKKSAVKEYADCNNLRCLQPKNLKDENFVEELKMLEADLFVVLAFRMLPKVVWQVPKNGTINLHASLLPNYRGAAPINWAIINGEKKTGVTTFFINEKIDTGKIIHQKEIIIENDDNAGTLHDKIMINGADLLLKTINDIENNDFKEIAQDDFIAENMQPKPAPKIFRSDCKIDWNKNVAEIYNFIRGLNPYPGAWSEILVKGKKKSIKIFDVKVSEQANASKIKTISVADKYFSIACQGGEIQVVTAQLEGKRRMKSEEILKGFNFLDCEIK